MRDEYLRILQTPAVARAQRAAYGRAGSVSGGSSLPRALGVEERAYIEARDSFYMASLSESGWPYLQHRGGPAGFLKVIDERRLVFLDQEGNRQLISAGNVATEDRVSLFLMDYRARERLKLLCRARCVELADEPEVASLFSDAERLRARRLFVLEVVGFDWNCPKFITQRFTRAEVEEALGALRSRIEELETELESRGE